MFGYLPSDSEISQLQVGEYAQREMDRGRERRSQPQGPELPARCSRLYTLRVCVCVCVSRKTLIKLLGLPGPTYQTYIAAPSF